MYVFVSFHNQLLRSVLAKCLGRRKARNNNGIQYHPALIISPFDIQGESEALKKWTDMFKKYERSEGKLVFLVYFYSDGYSRSSSNNPKFQAFGIVKESHIVEYDKGE